MPVVDVAVRVSPHFTWGELTTTNRRALQAANRDVPEAHQRAIEALCTTVLEPIRAHVGRPVIVTSGYRSAALNAAIPGASPTSQHTKGEAADIVIPGVDHAEVWRWLWTESRIPFGQVILERPPGKDWLHVSLGEPWRDPGRCRQALTFDGRRYALAGRASW